MKSRRAILLGIFFAVIIFSAVLSSSDFYFTTRQPPSRKSFDRNAAIFSNTSTQNAPHTSPVSKTLVDETPPEILRVALNGGDISIAMEKSSRYLEEHTEGMAILLSSFRVETEPKMISLLGKLITDYADAQACEVAGELAQHDPIPEKREAALKILRNASDITAELLQAVRRISREDANAQVRLVAHATLDHWLREPAETTTLN